MVHLILFETPETRFRRGCRFPKQSCASFFLLALADPPEQATAPARSLPVRLSIGRDTACTQLRARVPGHGETRRDTEPGVSLSGSYPETALKTEF